MRLDDTAIKAALTMLFLTALALTVGGYGGIWGPVLLGVLLIGTVARAWVPLWRNRRRR